ncbi:MAG: copper chaperone PCu(A)C [Actinomycetia bacterium]|nr:copper chaperone PCu(A)C [Actinomycetes bacterium]
MNHTLHPLTRRVSIIGLCALSALSFASCGDDEKSSSATTPDITVEGQWARTSPAMATAGAVYLTITSPVDDKLVAAKIDPSITGTVEIHETVMADAATDTTMAMGSDTTMAMGSDTTMAMGDGEMTMRPVEFIDLPAGVAVALEPGGYHIMLLDLVQPLEVGTTIQVTLVFETAGEVTIDVPVLDEAP